MSDDAIFGCGRHGGKLFGAHTDEEKTEDGWIRVKAGQWKKATDLGMSKDQAMLIRAFDSGVVPDAHSQEHAGEWRKLGGEYMDGVGPVVRSNKQLEDWSKVSGIFPKGSFKTVEDSRPGLYGYNRKTKKKKRVYQGFDGVYEQIRRTRSEIIGDARDWDQDVKNAESIRQQVAKNKQNTKRFFFVKR